MDFSIHRKKNEFQEQLRRHRGFDLEEDRELQPEDEADRRKVQRKGHQRRTIGRRHLRRRRKNPRRN